jgi:RHS repeat-associated protein
MKNKNIKVNYFITDHLGSTRVVVNNEGTVLGRNDYYPFGKLWESDNIQAPTTRYLFSGKEKQTIRDLGWLDFSARMYANFEIPIFTTPDPLMEKYYYISPYVYCAGNPINYVDPTGMFFKGVYGDAMGNYYDIKGQPTLYANASTYITTSGEILKHFDDGDPKIYIVPDDWTGSPDELKFFGYESRYIDYSENEGNNINDVGYSGSDPRLYPNDPPITPDYTLDALAVPILGWLKYVKLGKLFNFLINKGGQSIAKTPVGRSGNILKITTKNSPKIINGTKFTGHALDQMQSRGIISPYSVLDVVKNPTQILSGSTQGTIVFIKDNLKVVTNNAGDIITVMWQ